MTSWKPIVVGVNRASGSIRSAAMGAILAQRAHTTCTFVHAVPDYEQILAGQGIAVNAGILARDAMERDREAMVTSLRGHIPDALLDGIEVRVGWAPDVLAQVARREDAGLIIVGGNRRGRHFGRRTIAHLARTSDVPLLVTAGDAVVARVLAAVDLSIATRPTIEAAQRWAELFGAQLRVLHVVEPVPLVPGVPMGAVADEQRRSEERLIELNVRSLISLRDTQLVTRAGPAATAIAGEVAEWHADLLVLGSHGKSWLDRLLIGSTTEHLLHHPPASCLIIPIGHRGPAHGLGVGALPWEEEHRVGV